MAYEDYKQPKTETFDYDAVTRDINANTDTVQGQIGGLLSSDSDYMKRAKHQGKDYAQSRGLLNSSIGAQASQAAAIDAALPIAQQDASTYLTQGLANQEVSNAANKDFATAQNAGALQDTVSGTTIANTALGNEGKKEVQSAADAAAMERLGVSEAGATERTNISESGALERLGIQEGGLLDRLGITEAGALERLNISEGGATKRSAAEIASREGISDSQIAAERQNLQDKISAEAALQTERVASDEKMKELGLSFENMLNQRDNDTRIALGNMELAADDRLRFTDYFNQRSTWTNNEIARLAEHPDLTPDEKNQRIAETNTSYTQDLQLIADLYAIPLSFTGEADPTVPGDNTSGTGTDVGTETGGGTTPEVVYEEPPVTPDPVVTIPDPPIPPVRPPLFGGSGDGDAGGEA